MSPGWGNSSGSGIRRECIVYDQIHSRPVPDLFFAALPPLRLPCFFMKTIELVKGTIPFAEIASEGPNQSDSVINPAQRPHGFLPPGIFGTPAQPPNTGGP